MKYKMIDNFVNFILNENSGSKYEISDDIKTMILVDIKEISTFMNMNVIDVQHSAFGEPKPEIIVETFEILKGGTHVIMSFFDKGDADKCIDFLSGTECSTVTKFNIDDAIRIKGTSTKSLSLYEFNNIALSQNLKTIDYDVLNEVYVFLIKHPYLTNKWKHGMNLDEFKHNNRGSIAAKRYDV